MPAGLSQMIQSNLLAQLGDDAADALVGQRILVAGLRGRQQPQILQPLVADQRLRELGDALHDIDEVEHDAPFGAHDEIEIAQADVEVDDDDLLAAFAPAPRRARLSRSSFRRRPCRTSRPGPWPFLPPLPIQFSGAIFMMSPSSQA